MKARIITKIFVHYLKNDDPGKGKYHFILCNDIMINAMPIFSNSSIDNDAQALHFGCVNYIDLPQKVTALADKLGYIDAKIIELTEETVINKINPAVKPKNKKK